MSSSRRLSQRVVDPTRCWIRHVRRTVAGEVGTTLGNLGAAYIAGAEDALAGRQGWQSGDLAVALSDDGEATIRFPNAAGGDGVLHRERFAILTDPDYRVGEEWIEVMREPHTPLIVFTPTKYTKSRTEVTISGTDVAGALAGYNGTEVDVWDGQGPRDVIEHYTRLPDLAAGIQFDDYPGAVTPYQGWAVGASSTAGAGGSVRQTGASGSHSEGVSMSGLTLPGECWEMEARVRVTAIGTTGPDILFGPITRYMRLFLASGDVNLEMATGSITERITAVPLSMPGAVALRLVAHYDRVFAFVNGELVAQYRRTPPYPTVAGVQVNIKDGTFEVDAIEAIGRHPFAMRGAGDKGDRQLPGIPPAGGLRARYYNAATAYGRSSTRFGRAARLAPLGEEPVTDRLEQTVNYTILTTPNYPPGLPGAYLARWTGAIYLDLAAADRRIRLRCPGAGRIYVGKTLRSEPAVAAWDTGSGATIIETPPLRSHIGQSVAGWYPIIVEAHDDRVAGLVEIADSPLDGGGVATGYAVVPASRLSPVGGVDDHMRYEPHREVIGQVAEAFGLQWRTEPRTLESGTFPGAIVPRVRVGRDTEIVVDDLGTDAVVEGDAGDSIDRLSVDAAGIADPKGSGQLTAVATDYDAAGDHLAVRSAYESLSEITERSMLETRIGSLLALRSSPNEQVGVRPPGALDLADTFPLSGALARMEWRPGDGVRLELADLDVIDRTPRQLTKTAWGITPDGRTAPTVGFRQRPRSPAAVLRRTLRAVYAQARNYQGTLVAIPGSPAANSLVAGGAGSLSVGPLPVSDEQIVAVYFALTAFSAGTANLEVNGTATGVVMSPTRLGWTDVTRWVTRIPLTDHRMTARLTGASGVTTVEYQLIAIVRL